MNASVLIIIIPVEETISDSYAPACGNSMQLNDILQLNVICRIIFLVQINEQTCYL